MSCRSHPVTVLPGELQALCHCRAQLAHGRVLNVAEPRSERARPGRTPRHVVQLPRPVVPAYCDGRDNRGVEGAGCLVPVQSMSGVVGKGVAAGAAILARGRR